MYLRGNKTREMKSITLEYAQDLGALSMATDSDIFSAIEAQYNKENNLYVVEVKDIQVGVDNDSVYHMESGIILDWFDVDFIHESIEFSSGSFLDDQGIREEY